VESLDCRSNLLKGILCSLHRSNSSQKSIILTSTRKETFLLTYCRHNGALHSTYLQVIPLKITSESKFSSSADPCLLYYQSKYRRCLCSWSRLPLPNRSSKVWWKCKRMDPNVCNENKQERDLVSTRNLY